MVISWILNALSKEIFESVVFASTAYKIWQDLEERFGRLNGAQLFQVLKELYQIYQGTTSITICFTKIKALWYEIQSIITFPLCSSGFQQEV